MKVLYTANTYTHLYLCHKPYLKWFHDQGFIVHTATNSTKKLDNVDKNFNISVERFPFKLRNIKAVFELKKIIEKEKYNIIHTHTPMGAAITRLASIKYRKNNDVRIIYTAHGFHFYKGCKIINWLIYYPVEKFLSKFTDLIITMNKEDFEFAKKHFKTKIEYIPGIGFNQEKFKSKLSEQDQKKLRKKLKIKENSYVISYIAEISKRKRQLYLLKTIKKMNLTNEQFLLIGNNTKSQKIKRYIKKNNLEKNVKIIGFQDNIGDYLDISDLVISVSSQEGLPLNIMEAMYKNKPIIVTNCRGNIDLIQNNKNGLVVNINNKKELINSILYLKNNLELSKRLGKSNNKIISKYSIDNVLPIMENIYNKEIKKAKRLNITELQKIEYDMLQKLAKHCEENNIEYFLGCGTLFGASVKNGFFSWDDDIDILMPRKEYEKFIKTFNDKNTTILTCDNKDYYYPYAKMIDTRTTAYECKNNIKNYGVFIDIFPIDGVPNTLYLHLLMPIKYLMLSQWGCHLSDRKKITKIIYKMLSIITFVFPKNFFAKMLNNICRIFSLTKYEKAGIVCHYKSKRELVNSGFFQEKVKIRFENHKFWAPKLYKEYLKELYGEYQERTHRIGHKHFKAYWK